VTLSAQSFNQSRHIFTVRDDGLVPIVRSAGILLYRLRAPRLESADADLTSDELEVWIAHMGGPFWARKDAGAWSIPKGEYGDEEDALVAARREFAEEIGSPAPDVAYELLGEFRQSSGKVVTVFFAESDFQVESVVSNSFELEWPPRSRRIQLFPEIDDARWCNFTDARTKLVKGQVPMLDALETRVITGR
jgi:predicted NUDIX family NTP pyrophosphohydrolase